MNDRSSASEDWLCTKYSSPVTPRNFVPGESEFRCKVCGAFGDEHLEQGTAFYNCIDCGACYGQVMADSFTYGGGQTDPNLSYYPKVRRDKDGKVIANVSIDIPKRYRPIMHYKERLAQW